MATTPVAPPAAAPAAAAPSTPSPVSTPAPVSTPTPAPAAPVSTPAPSEPKSMADRLAEGWEKAKASVPLEEGTEPAPAAEAPPAETPAEEPAAAAPEAETPAAEPEAAAAPTETPAEEYTLDDGVAADPASFAKELKADPVAEKFFNDRPDLKNKVFGALRRDTENREIRQYIPDVETAKVVTQAATTFQQIDNRFLQATTPEGAQEFLNHWVREAMFVDDKGQPIMEDGKYKLHPAITYIFDHITSNKLSVLGEQAKTKGDERLQAAVDILKEALSPSSSALGEFPDELKPHADALKAEREALNKEREASTRQAREQQQAANEQSIDRALNKAAETVQGLLKPQFAKSGLTDFEQTAALRTIGEQVDAKLEENSLYQSIYDSILQDPPSEAREKRLMKHMMTYTNELLGPIAAKVIRDAKGGALTRQADTQARVDAQKNASKTDPRGTSIAPSAPQASSPAQLRGQVIQDLTATLGRDPEMPEIMAEMWKRQNQPRK